MTKPYGERATWFCTGSQDLYGEDTLRQVAEQSRRIAAQLDASATVPAKVVWKPVLKDRDSIHRMALEATAEKAMKARKL